MFVKYAPGILLLCGIAIVAPALVTPVLAQDRAAIAAASAAERQREMNLLGIARMQKGATAYDIGAPGNANYDEARANPYPDLPPLMVLNDGTTVTTPAQWQARRAQIKALFDENVYGKYPAHIPGVTWRVTGTERRDVAGIAAIVKHVTGRVDNSAAPSISVSIDMDVVTPAATQGRKVPVIIGGGSIRPRPVFHRPPGAPVHLLKQPDTPPDSAQLLLAKGWGFVWIDYNGVQADNGAGLGKGIIGLTNRGKPRSLDDWGVLRAWAWADSRALDYLQTDADVNAKAVGVMGHSRGGKAALVAMVDDPRIAIGYISSSGAGGANLYRRNYGETIGNLAGSNEFHWFAGNFLRYAAAGHTPNEMPVDSHEFIALVAPRPVFFGGGALITDPDYAPGDAWQDARGMFMAASAASSAWTLLGHKGLGSGTFPPMDTLIDSGDVAWRQHPYGHTPAPNWPAFIAFASRYLKAAP
ncbi:MAG: acetylxylan esterase [Alphaproteobacteria bacterium]|nr:acetylxylan esterase [Alphaproteobacteria bacterium]